MANTRAIQLFRTFMKVCRQLKLTKFKEYGLAGEKLANKYKLTSPLGRTKRKERTKSHDMWGSNIYCDAASFWRPETQAKLKIEKRIEAGLCRGCGNKPDDCRCKRKSEE